MQFRVTADLNITGFVYSHLGSFLSIIEHSGAIMALESISRHLCLTCFSLAVLAEFFKISLMKWMKTVTKESQDT